MKAITIKQPWAHAILHLGKDVENRDWPTKLRGTIAVHTSKALDRAEVWFFDTLVKERSIVLPDSTNTITIGELPLGAIVGTVEIIDCVTHSDSPWFVGDYGFVLANPRPLVTPIPFRGMLGFWDVPKEIEGRFECSEVY